MFVDVRHARNAVNLSKKGFVADARKKQMSVFARSSF
jgi:hypothetical protein